MIRKIKVFFKRKFRDKFKKLISKKDIELLSNKNFVIISNNCWGGTLYRWYNRSYNSPFVGLFLYGPCYIKLLSNFDFYIKQELNFIEASSYKDRIKDYPVALLGDVEIHFTHYDSEEEAKEKWERRTARMLEENNKERYFFKICDRERVTKEHLIQFHNLPLKNKISFAINDYDELKGKNHIKMFESHKNKKRTVPNGKKVFKLTFLYFNLNKWLLSGAKQ